MAIPAKREQHPPAVGSERTVQLVKDEFHRLWSTASARQYPEPTGTGRSMVSPCGACAAKRACGCGLRRRLKRLRDPLAQLDGTFVSKQDRRVYQLLRWRATLVERSGSRPRRRPRRSGPATATIDIFMKSAGSCTAAAVDLELPVHRFIVDWLEGGPSQPPPAQRLEGHNHVRFIYPPRHNIDAGASRNTPWLHIEYHLHTHRRIHQ